jgi:hypothetical protein
MSLIQIHAALANACLLFSLIIAGYGFLRYVRAAGVDGSFLGALAAGELLYLAQVAVGIGLLFTPAARPARLAIHILYGAVLALMVPATYAITGGRDSRREVLAYALVGLFLAGISLRAMATSSLVGLGAGGP